MRRWPWLLSSALVVLAPSAHAVPSAANSHIPSHILLVGRKLDLADTSSGAFTVTVHDVANVPVANSTVEVRILNCPGARLSTQTYVPGSTIRCGTAGVLGTTDGNGEVRLTVVGGGQAGAPAGAGPCVQIFASGVPLGTATLAYLDMDGSSGVGATDLALWLTDFGSGEDIGRSDYDGDGLLSAGDLSVWLTVWGAGDSDQSAASYCP
ncbi:MAG TPA: hypothetical protein VN896_00875 [Methylomirabilota bacterium]|nr:hypothetical protein [Methylomirabilota bacterium]